MKVFALVLSAVLVLCSCERHSAEETAPFHEEHSGSHTENSRGGLTDTTRANEHSEKPATEPGH